MMCLLVASFVIASRGSAPYAAAQESGDVPVIRVETEQVLVPTVVFSWVPESVPFRLYGYFDVLHLTVRDFHLLADEREQRIDSAALVRPYQTDVARDNLGYQLSVSLTPRGEWTNLRVSRHDLNPMVADPLYMIAYRPPPSPEGSCHRIKITVSPRDASGRKLTAAESPSALLGNVVLQPREEEVKRSKLLLRYRAEFCNIAHAASDPLFGNPVSAELENLATNDKADQEGFYLSSFDLFDESGAPRIHVALDFPQLSTQTGNPGFQASLLGIFNRTNGGLAARFSDSKWEGWFFPDKDTSGNNEGLDYSYNHYETEVDLPPGDYDLHSAIDFGGALRRAEVPVTVPAPAQRLAVSGIALCRRYFEHNQIPTAPQLPPDGIRTMPIEMEPLVSKGIEFTPTGDTHFKKDDPMAAYFEVYEPLLVAGQLLGDGPNVHAQFEMRVIDASTGAIKFDSGFRPADGFVRLDRAVIPISEQVAIGQLGPGEYRLQVRAMDSAGDTTDWRTTSFTRE